MILAQLMPPQRVREFISNQLRPVSSYPPLLAIVLLHLAEVHVSRLDEFFSAAVAKGSGVASSPWDDLAVLVKFWGSPLCMLQRSPLVGSRAIPYRALGFPG